MATTGKHLTVEGFRNHGKETYEYDVEGLGVFVCRRFTHGEVVDISRRHIVDGTITDVPALQREIIAKGVVEPKLTEEDLLNFVDDDDYIPKMYRHIGREGGFLAKETPKPVAPAENDASATGNAPS